MRSRGPSARHEPTVLLGSDLCQPYGDVCPILRRRPLHHVHKQYVVPQCVNPTFARQTHRRAFSTLTKAPSLPTRRLRHLMHPATHTPLPLASTRHSTMCLSPQPPIKWAILFKRRTQRLATPLGFLHYPPLPLPTSAMTTLPQVWDCGRDRSDVVRIPHPCRKYLYATHPQHGGAMSSGHLARPQDLCEQLFHLGGTVLGSRSSRTLESNHCGDHHAGRWKCDAYRCFRGCHCFHSSSSDSGACIRQHHSDLRQCTLTGRPATFARRLTVD